MNGNSTLGNLLSQFEDIQVPTSKTSSDASTQGKRPAAKFWVNVGLRRNGKLLTLPMGIPLDNLKSKAVPKQAGDFQSMRKAEAQLWEKIQELMSTMKPGESKTLPFEVEIRKVTEEEQIEETSNPFDLGDFKL